AVLSCFCECIRKTETIREAIDHESIGDKGSEEILWQRRESCKGSGRREPLRGERRVCRHRGNQRQRKIDAASYAGRTGLSDGGQCVCGWKRHFRAEGGCFVHFPEEKDRVCVPEL